MATATVLQDHTEFMIHMMAAAMDHHQALPLNTTVLERIRTELIVLRHNGELITLQKARRDMHTFNKAEQDRIARAAATAVEGQVEAWLCMADDEGFEALIDECVGPVLRWNGAAWWGRIKGVKVNTEIQFHEAFKPRKNRRPRKGADRQDDQQYRPMGGGGSLLRGASVQPLD